MTRALVVAAAVMAAACSPPLVKLPAGAGVSVGDTAAAAALMQATAECVRVRTLTAEIALSGSARGHRLRGRISAGIAAPDSARLEAVAPFGQPLFIFVAVREDATLLLPRDLRILEHGRADAVLDAVAGVPLSVADLETIVTGCVPSRGENRPAVKAEQFGSAWMVLGEPGGGAVYLRRENEAARWNVAAIVRRNGQSAARWRADYADRQNDMPRSIRLTSLDENERPGTAFDLRLALSQLDINVPLGPEVFTIDVPRSVTRMTLDELRASGVVSAR